WLKKHPQRRPVRLSVELLEDRLAPAILTVNSVFDTTTADTSLTLREALKLVNASGNATSALGRNLTSQEQAQVTGTFGTNDTIQFSPAATGTLTLGGTELPQITKNVSIVGPGAATLTVSGNNASRIFDIANSTTVSISGLTLTNGLVTGNSAASIGGAVQDLGNLTLTNVTVQNSTANTG